MCSLIERKSRTENLLYHLIGSVTYTPHTFRTFHSIHTFFSIYSVTFSIYSVTAQTDFELDLHKLNITRAQRNLSENIFNLIWNIHSHSKSLALIKLTYNLYETDKTQTTRSRLSHQPLCENLGNYFICSIPFQNRCIYNKLR